MDYSKKPGQKIEKIGKLKNTEKPTISIVTPFYNGGATLMETSNSVFSQTYPYFEWIIVDDGSKDKESLKKLDELGKLDKRVKIFHKENGGPSIARDFGINKTNKETKYVFFLDCDDILDHTMLECLYWTLETHPDASFAYTTMVNFGDREFLWEQYLTVEREIEENVICISSMVKKDDLIEVGCFGIKEKAMYEDWNLWLKLLEKGKKPIRVNAPLFWYRVSDTGEFSRAKKNNENAMKYVRETASRIMKDVEVIQFPREGKKYNFATERENMILPLYQKDKKTKILFLFPWMVVGGADIFNLELIKRLDSSKYESIVLTTLPSENPLRQEFEEYASLVYDMASFLERKDYINFTDYIIESHEIDAVVVSNTHYGYYMVPYLKRKYPKIPFIDYIHSIDMQDPREGFGRCSLDVDQYLTNTYCCNNFTKKQLVDRYHKSNVETLYIGTDNERFDPKKFDKELLKEKYQIPKDKKIISFIARLSDEKRPLMFIDICNKLIKKYDDLYFVIAGDGYLMNKVKSRVNQNFKLLGMIDKSEEVYSISDITVNCSSLEGLALTSYESLSMGVPVVSTDVGGQTELIDETVGGIVHYNENPTSEIYKNEVNNYVNEIERVLNNIDEISKNCRNKINKQFTLNHMVLKFQKIISDNIDKSSKDCYNSNSFIEYNLALENFYKNYYYYCKNYLENKFDIIYEEPKIRKKVKRIKSSKRRKFINFLNRNNIRYESKIIVDFLRSLKRGMKELLISIKFFIKSIPASICIIFKLFVGRFKK